MNFKLKWIQTTLFLEPGTAPNIVSFESITSCIEITVTKPSKPNGVIRAYQVL